MGDTLFDNRAFAPLAAQAQVEGQFIFNGIKRDVVEPIFADKTVSVTELKRNFTAVMEEAAGGPVAILNHNKPEAYLLPASYYERLLERLEDLGDAKLIMDRGDGPFVEAALEEL